MNSVNKIPCMNCGSLDTKVYPAEDKDEIVVECNACGFQLKFSIN